VTKKLENAKTITAKKVERLRKKKITGTKQPKRISMSET